MYARRVLKHFGEFQTGDTLLDLEGIDLADGYRRLLGTSHLTRDGDVLKRDGSLLHADETQVAALSSQLEGGVAHVGELDLVVGLHHELEVAIQVGDRSVGGSKFHNSNADQGFAGLGVHYGSCYFLRLSKHHNGCQQAEKQSK